MIWIWIRVRIYERWRVCFEYGNGYNEVWCVLDWQGIEPMAMSISKLTIPPSHSPSYTLSFPPSSQPAQCLPSNGKPSIIRHIYRKHAFAPLLHFRILASIMVLVKMRLLFISSSSLILTHSNTLHHSGNRVGCEGVQRIEQCFATTGLISMY